MPSITGAESNQLRDLVASAEPRGELSSNFRLNCGPLDSVAILADTPHPRRLAIACIAKERRGRDDASASEPTLRRSHRASAP